MRAVTGAVLALAIGGEALANEEPRYEVIERREDFELRRYEPHWIAEVEVTGDFDEVGVEAFRILAAYIGGQNRTAQEISMTAPVTQEPVGEEIAMTAPVTQSPTGAEGTYAIAFAMPAAYTGETLPVPDDPRVAIRQVPGRLLAARRYSGFWREGNFRAQEASLLAAIAEAGYETIGPPVYARYDPPFKLWFLRRNEVLVEVRPAAR